MVCDLLVIHIPGLRNVFPGFHSQNLCCRSSCLLIISKAGNILIYLLGNCCRQHSGIRSRIRHQFLLIKLLHDPECFIRTDLKELGALKEKYKEKLDIRIGVEFGLQPHLAKKAKAFTAANPYDFVIGSMHVVGGKDPYYPEFFEGISDEEAYRMALQETIADIRAVADFDVLGHLDYVVRYGKHREQEYSYGRFADEIDEILRYLIEHGKGLEVNTAGLKYGLPFAHPHPDVLKRYKKLGGEIITVGADAHKPEHVGYDFNIVDNILEACGFKYYAEFIKRAPVFRKIK